MGSNADVILGQLDLGISDAEKDAVGDSALRTPGAQGRVDSTMSENAEDMPELVALVRKQIAERFDVPLEQVTDEFIRVVADERETLQDKLDEAIENERSVVEIIRKSNERILSALKSPASVDLE